MQTSHKCSRRMATNINSTQRLSVEWRRTFAEGFFALSRHPLPMSHKHTEPSTTESELKSILTWEYFHKEEQESEFTDSEFSGLDWVAMAWSLHLAQQSRSGPEVDEEFVLRALCKLLEASPYYQIIPIIPKFYEFTQWFDDTDLPEYRRMICTRVGEAVRRHEEFQVLHKFDKFQCMCYI